MQRHLYPDNWKQRVAEADSRAGGRCEGCGAILETLCLSRKRNLYFLPLHTCHVNHDPDNPQAEVQKLCPRCHWKTHPWLQGTRDQRSKMKRGGYQPITAERLLRAARNGGLALAPEETGRGYTWQIAGLSGHAPDVLDAISSALHCLRMERLEQGGEGYQHG